MKPRDTLALAWLLPLLSLALLILPPIPAAQAAPVAGGISITITPTEMQPADAGFVSVSGAYPLRISVTLDGAPLEVFRGSDAYWALFVFGFDEPPGEHQIQVEVVNPATREVVKKDAVITVLEHEFPRESVALPWSLTPLLDPAINEQENAWLDSIYAVHTYAAGWDWPFGHPAINPVITSRFGNDRSYNGGMWAQYHTGVDYRVAIGEPVLAVADGWVVAAEMRDVRGNVLLIDHGHGVFTQYAHLSEFFVSKGAFVRGGQLVALAGATGRTSGPHLHLEVIVHGQPVDPIRWMALAPGFVPPREVRATPQAAGDDPPAEAIAGDG
ncbi:MAG: hypothetical protein Kow00124_03260 [Anaerolineae bacterium]